jgi:hypothetical protein
MAEGPPAEKPGSIMPNLSLNAHELDVLVAIYSY